MKRIKNKQIATAHGIATCYKRKKNWSYGITLDDKKIPKNKRRIRKALGYISEECLEEKVKLDIAKIYKKIKKGISVDTNPVSFIRNTYIPHIKQLATTGSDTENGRGIWSKKKLNDDTSVIESYIIPFLLTNKLDWDELKPKTMLRYDLMLKEKGLSISSMSKKRAVLNDICRFAIIYELMDYMPIHPRLPKHKRIRGQRMNSYAFPTDQMMMDLLDVAEEEKYRIFRGRNEKSIWNRTIAYWWLHIIYDTGIRPFSKIPFHFSNIATQDDGTISFWRKEKGIEYRAQGGKDTIKALDNLRLMYRRKGIKPNHILSKMDGTPTTKTNWYLRKLLKKAHWTVDEDGRRYAPHSIRKWHINNACHYEPKAERETYDEIAERVGHSVETLINYYVKPHETKITRPTGLTDNLKQNSKIIRISQNSRS